MKILKFRIIFILNVRQLFGMTKKKKKPEDIKLKY